MIINIKFIDIFCLFFKNFYFLIFKNKEIKKLSECNIDKLIRDSSTQVSDRASLLAIKMLAKASEERPTIEELCSFIEE